MYDFSVSDIFYFFLYPLHIQTTKKVKTYKIDCENIIWSSLYFYFILSVIRLKKKWA